MMENRKKYFGNPQPVQFHDNKLAGLVEWKDFEETSVRNSSSSLLPTILMKDELKNIDEWNNIPLPLINSIKYFDKSIRNLTHLVCSLEKKVKEKTLTIANQFKIIDKAYREEDFKLNQSIEAISKKY